jgi:N-acyl-D-aspartate/D-glutamate deacylase
MLSKSQYPVFKAILILLALFLFWSCEKVKEIEVDLLIKNGRVYLPSSVTPGEENPQILDIAFVNDTIAYISQRGSVLFQAKKIIDAAGKVVSPGFIDPHTHATDDLYDSIHSRLLPWLHQGVTTLVVGNDGTSPLPVGEAMAQWESVGMGTNVAVLVGHGTARRTVMDMADRAPTDDELEAMKGLVENALADGAIGMSTGLYYAPGSFASTDEIVALATIVAKKGGVYDSHIRDESSYNIGVVNSIRENIIIGAKSGVKIHISHIKALGVDVWGKSQEIIDLIDSARSAGIDVTANQYPYTASGTSMGAAIFPTWAREGGKEAIEARLSNASTRAKILTEMEENIRRRGGGKSILTTRSKTAEIQGKRLSEIAAGWSVSEAEAALRIFEEGDSKIASFNMDENDINLLMQQPWVVTGSDGSSGHPRKYGTFIRKLNKYVVTDSVLLLSQFIYNSSEATADILGLAKRGKLEVGNFADIIIFDPKQVKDVATFESPEQFSKGIDYVIVNGIVTIEKGRYQNVKAGKILKKN